MKKEKVYLTGLILVLCALITRLDLIQNVDRWGADLLQRPHSPAPHIVILAIDNKSIQAIGRWPWNRSIHGALIDRLKKDGARAIGVDILFSEKQSVEEDGALQQSIARANIPIALAGEVVYTKGSSAPTEFISPIADFTMSDAVQVGHTFVTLDADGYGRQFPAPITIGATILEPFSFLLARDNKKTPILHANQWINFAGPAGTFPTYSTSDLLDGKIPPEIIHDAIILVGATASDLHDTVPVPLGNGVMAGVEWHANSIDNILLNRARWVMPARIIRPVALFITAILGAILSVLPTTLGIVTVLVLCLVWFIASYIASMLNIVLFFFSPLLVFALMFVAHSFQRWYVAEMERRQLRQTLQLYFSPQVLRKIMADPASLKLGGERKEVTILFSDIRSFTTITEQTSPELLSQLLHEYFTEMTEEVLATDGVIDKFIGDAIMAFWGAPFDQADQADRAIRAAQGMIKRLISFQERCRERGWPFVDIGIGIHTGPATVGNMGSAKRFDYTVIGDSVNLAARLEGLNKEYKTHIIISEATKNKAKTTIATRELATVVVKGKTEPVKIFSVLSS